MSQLDLKAIREAVEVDSDGTGALDLDDVAAAVERLVEYQRVLGNQASLKSFTTSGDITAILRALTASVADVQRLREALENAAALVNAEFSCCENTKGKAMLRCSICGPLERAALTTTPPTGLVVVDGDELTALRAMRERATITEANQATSRRILHGEATDA